MQYAYQATTYTSTTSSGNLGPGANTDAWAAAAGRHGAVVALPEQFVCGIPPRTSGISLRLFEARVSSLVLWRRSFVLPSSRLLHIIASSPARVWSLSHGHGRREEVCHQVHQHRRPLHSPTGALIYWCQKETSTAATGHVRECKRD